MAEQRGINRDGLDWTHCACQGHDQEGLGQVGVAGKGQAALGPSVPESDPAQGLNPLPIHAPSTARLLP